LEGDCWNNKHTSTANGCDKDVSICELNTRAENFDAVLRLVKSQENEAKNDFDKLMILHNLI
jgi:hypothetical protein